MSGGQDHIDSFLRMGYFVDYEAQRCPIDFSRVDKRQYEECPYDDLARIGVGTLREAFSTIFESGRDHVVPLSGGLDSRLILCALLEHTEAEKIRTYTFGVSGSYDFEIGRRVALTAGTRHVSFPMNAISWHEDELIDVAKREDCQAVLFYNQPLRQIEELFAGCLFWSGYLGDVVAGSRLCDPPSPTLEDAKLNYLRNRTFVRSVRIWRCDDDELLPLLAGGGFQPGTLTWDEQVFFDEAAAKYTVAHVLWEGFEYATPFINTPWMDFLLSVPNRSRLGQRLMVDIGRAAFPTLFNLPSKNRLGHTFDTSDVVVRATFWSNRARKLAHQFLPWVNYPPILYNDFNEGIRGDPGLRRVVQDSIEDLRLRGVCNWVDFDSIWRRHDRRIRNHGDALIVLASLELVLKAQEDRSQNSSTASTSTRLLL